METNGFVRFWVARFGCYESKTPKKPAGSLGGGLSFCWTKQEQSQHGKHPSTQKNTHTPTSSNSAVKHLKTYVYYIYMHNIYVYVFRYILYDIHYLIFTPATCTWPLHLHAQDLLVGDSQGRRRLHTWVHGLKVLGVTSLSLPAKEYLLRKFKTSWAFLRDI